MNKSTRSMSPFQNFQWYCCLPSLKRYFQPDFETLLMSITRHLASFNHLIIYILKRGQFIHLNSAKISCHINFRQR